jgi:predicted CoA-substrate-specific enzyme activase
VDSEISRSGLGINTGVPRNCEKLRLSDDKVLLGIDIGSTSSDIAILDTSKNVLFTDYARTRGRPVDTVRSQLKAIFDVLPTARIESIVATGSAGRLVARMLGIPFVNEVPAQAQAISHLYPELTSATIIEMGGQDSKLIYIRKEHGRNCIHDFALNTVCAAGTGSFLDQQAQRLGVKIEDEFGELALKSQTAPRIAGRCSVFAKSDMIHLQQLATPVHDIIAGLCMGLARNLKSNLGAGREITKPIVFTGGVASNAGVVRAIENVLGLTDGELLVPQMHLFTGAIGAILLVCEKETTRQHRYDTALLLEKLVADPGALENAPRLSRLPAPSFPAPQSPIQSIHLTNGDKVDSYIGVDVGSISTNVVVMDQERRVLSKAYVMTAGKPIEAVRQGLEIVAAEVGYRVRILGAASTGSGRYLTGDFIGADIVINEITAQAQGAAIVNPEVDTIFEIGGQDSKYISLENGVVVDFEMNHACAAGTGSFLEEQAQKLGIRINREFADLAFRSDNPLKLGERCTVFMESDLLNFQQQGALSQDLVAGLSYSIVTNYLNRVVGRRKIGDNICFQGGTAFNKAVWAAFEQVTGKRVMVPDHHEVTGALGAAAIAAEYMQGLRSKSGANAATKFRGFDNLTRMEYVVKAFVCQHCSNDCEIREVQIPGSEPLYYGSRCDRYNLRKDRKRRAHTFDAFKFREDLLFECAGISDDEKVNRNVTIGLPLALGNLQMLPLFARFFKELGFRTVISGKTTKAMVRKGLELSAAPTCFPVKVAYGHVAELVDRKCDYVFLPSVVSMPDTYGTNESNHLCPYVQTLPYQIAAAMDGKLAGTQILTAPVRLGDGRAALMKGFVDIGSQLGIPAKSARKAVDAAMKAQASFESRLREKGRDIISSVGKDEQLFVLVSRPYNGCDSLTNLELPKKLAENGRRIIPVDMLPLRDADLKDHHLHGRMYWKYGQHILRAAELISRDPRLHAIYLSNFSCGPDSFLITFFRNIMGRKPSLLLELDEHSADAGVVTRLEAFFESLKNYHPEPPAEKPHTTIASSDPDLKGRTLYIPWMGDSSHGFAAAFRAYGQDARVIPQCDETALQLGRRFTTGKECLPCTITAGDMLKLIASSNGSAGKIAFFMPTASGPCRLGMYNCLHRLILQQAGAKDVPIVAPSQNGGIYDLLKPNLKGASRTSFMKHIWTAAVGNDLLHKALLRLRPLSAQKDQVDALYVNMRERWCDAIEARMDLKHLCILMGDFAREMNNIPLDLSATRPRIGIVGEIYVRSHDYSNGNLIRRLEELGAVCEVAPLAEWVYYVDHLDKNDAWLHGQFGRWLQASVTSRQQHSIEHSLAVPLQKLFPDIAEGPIEHTLELASPYIHSSFEGEAVLSVGKVVEYHKRGFGGVINVMPFTCMPSTIVSTQTARLSRACDNMPILNLSFDGQEDPSLLMRLEAFVEQVRQRQFMTADSAVAAVHA